MRITDDHLLVADKDDLFKVSCELEPEKKWGPIMTPELVVVHYGVTHTLKSLVAAQRLTGYMAALSIDGFQGKREIVQMSPLNRATAHAGQSEWNGKPSCNKRSIGIEISNPGPLVRSPSGGLQTVYTKPIPWPEDDSVQAMHRLHGQVVDGKKLSVGYKYWAKYSPEEWDILLVVIQLLIEKYPTIVDVRGHDEVARPVGRKLDPGPALDMDELRRQVFGGPK